MRGSEISCLCRLGVIRDGFVISALCPVRGCNPGNAVLHPAQERGEGARPASYCFFHRLVGVAGFLVAGLALALSAALLMSSISSVTRAALLPRSLSKQRDAERISTGKLR